MKITHLIPGIDSSGGAERLLVQLANAMAGGNEVSILTYKAIPETSTYIKELSDKIKVVSMCKTKGFDLMLSLKLYRQLKKMKPEIVNAHLPSSFLYLVLSILLLKRTTFVFTIHSLPTHEEPRKWVVCLRKILVKMKRLALVTLSDVSETELKRYYGINSAAVILNGIAPPALSKELDVVKNEISRLKPTVQTKVFVNVGRIDSIKNQEMLCEVFYRLFREDKRDIILLIIGEPPNGGEAYLDDLKMQNYENVFFLGLKSNVADYLLCSNAFCLSSLKEGLPLVVLEALAVGLPVLSTPVGGVPDVIEQNVNGFLAKNYNLEEYKKLFDRYFEMNESDLDTIKKSNKKKFEQQYTINATCDKYLALYHSLIK